MSNSTNSTLAGALPVFVDYGTQGSNYATTATNVLYLFLLLPLMIKGRHRFFPEMLAIMGAMYFSTVYHACRDVGPSACPHDSTLNDTGRLDMMAAYIAVSAGTSPFVYAYSAIYKATGKEVQYLRAHPVNRSIWFTFMTLLTFTLLTWTSPNQEYLAFSLVSTFNLVVLIYCATIRFRLLADISRVDGSNSFAGRLVFSLTFVTGLIILCIGGLFRILLWSNAVSSYNTYHSIWHACGAISGFMFFWLLPSHRELEKMEALSASAAGTGGYVMLQQKKSVGHSQAYTGKPGNGMKGLL